MSRPCDNDRIGYVCEVGGFGPGVRPGAVAVEGGTRESRELRRGQGIDEEGLGNRDNLLPKLYRWTLPPYIEGF